MIVGHIYKVVKPLYLWTADFRDNQPVDEGSYLVYLGQSYRFVIFLSSLGTRCVLEDTPFAFCAAFLLKVEP